MATMIIPLTAPTFGGVKKDYTFTGSIQLPQVIADPIKVNSVTLYYGWGRCYYRDTFIELKIGATSFYSEKFTTENDDTLRERTVGLVCTAVGADHLLKVNGRTVNYTIRNNRSSGTGNVIDRPRDGNMVLTLNYDVLTSACTPPTALSVNPAVAEGTATLTGAGAGAGVSNAITGYEVSRCESSDGVNWNAWQVLQTVAATGTGFTLAVAPPGTRGNRYKYRARTLGSAGASYYSGYKESSNVLRRNAAPSAPGSLAPSATVYETGGLTLSWPAASDADGNLSYYELQYQSSADAATWSDWEAAGTQTGLSLVAYPSLTRAWYIRYRIRAVDALGVASGWTVSASVRRNSLPNAPASLAPSATLYESGGLTLSWPAVTDIDGNLSGYRVQAATSTDGTNWTAWATVQTVTGTSHAVTPSLARGQYIKYRVCALDALGAESGYRESAAIRRYALSTVALSKGSVNAGEPVSAVITPMADGLTHHVAWAFGAYGQVNELDANSFADTLNVPLPWLEHISKAVSGAASCTVTTLLNGVALGSVSAAFTITCPASVVPVIGSLSALPVSDTVPGAWGLYVKGHSRAQVTAGGIAPGIGAAITSISLYGGGGSAAGAALLSPILSTAGMAVFTCAVTDSRGRTAQKTVSVLVTDYQRPRLNDLSVFRANAASAEDRDGTRIGGSLVYGFDLIGQNSAGLKIYIDDSLVVDVGLSPQSVNYPISLSGPYDIMRTYTLKAVITDGLGESASITATINTARRQINIGAGLHGGIGFGMMALVEDAVQMPGDWPLLVGSLDVVQELGDLKEAALPKENVVDNLTATSPGYALDARQGKALDDKKLDKTSVANNLTTTDEGYALDARQGKALDDKKLDKASVANNLTTTDEGYALDARQGKALGESKVSKSGDTMTDNLNIARNDWPSVLLNPTSAPGMQGFLEADSRGLITLGMADSSTSRRFIQLKTNTLDSSLASTLELADRVNNVTTYHKIFHSGILDTVRDTIIIDTSPRSLTTATDRPWNYPSGITICGFGTANTNIYKPSTYGIMVTFRASSETAQLWFTQSNGTVYHRGGNATGWNGSATPPTNYGWRAITSA